MERFLHNHHAFKALKRLKTESKHLDRDWDDLEKRVEEKDIDHDYQSLLRNVLGMAEKDGADKRGKRNVTFVDVKNKYDGQNPVARLLQNQNCERVDCVVKAQSSKKRTHREIGKAQTTRKRTHREIRNIRAESSVAHKNVSDGNNLEQVGDGNDSDMEILDSAEIRKKGMLIPFVPNTRYHDSTDSDSQRLGSKSLADGFRKQVLDVLTKPFDEEELKRLREAVRDGSYYRHYPDFERKLKRHRYQRNKCLTILRGFFFWLQNMSQEGSFKPWKDGQCLAAEPGIPENPHLDRAKKSKRKIVK